MERLIVRQSSFKVNFCLKNRRYKGTCTLYFHPLCLFFFLFFFLSQAIVTKRFPCHNFTSGGNGIRFCNWKVEMRDGWRVEGESCITEMIRHRIQVFLLALQEGPLKTSFMQFHSHSILMMPYVWQCDKKGKRADSSTQGLWNQKTTLPILFWSWNV